MLFFQIFTHCVTYYNNYRCNDFNLICVSGIGTGAIIAYTLGAIASIGLVVCGVYAWKKRVE